MFNDIGVNNFNGSYKLTRRVVKLLDPFTLYFQK